MVLSTLQSADLILRGMPTVSPCCCCREGPMHALVYIEHGHGGMKLPGGVPHEGSMGIPLAGFAPAFLGSVPLAVLQTDMLPESSDPYLDQDD